LIPRTWAIAPLLTFALWQTGCETERIQDQSLGASLDSHPLRPAGTAAPYHSGAGRAWLSQPADLKLPPQSLSDGSASTTQVVGRIGTNRYYTPANQVLTPAGLQVSLPGMRPQGIALSPNGKLLVTAGKTHDLV